MQLPGTVETEVSVADREQSSARVLWVKVLVASLLLTGTHKGVINSEPVLKLQSLI